MAWLCLLIAGLLEIIWATGLKTTAGLTKLWPSVIVFVTSIGSFVLLARAMNVLPAGTSYAVWTGIGVVGTTIGGIILFNESASPVRLLCIGLILAGIIGLKLTTQVS